MKACLVKASTVARCQRMDAGFYMAKLHDSRLAAAQASVARAEASLARAQAALREVEVRKGKNVDEVEEMLRNKEIIPLG